MNFSEHKAIYLQIFDLICDEIQTGKYKAGERIPSIRNYSEMLEVNHNTTLRAFDLLQRNNLIFNKRGMGFYVSARAMDFLKEKRKQEFINNFLPKLFEKMESLDFTIKDIEELYKQRKLNPTNMHPL